MTHKLILFLVLLLLTGCQEEALEPTDDNRPNVDGSVGFRLKADDAAIDMEGLQTKGTPHNTLEKYNTVNVNVYSHTSEYDATTDNDVEPFREIELEQKDAKWEYDPHMVWPGDKKLSFMAYASDIAFAEAGITCIPSTGAPDSIKYTVPTDVSKQPDLLVSTLFNQTKVDNVSLTMKHALSCVSFCGDTPDKSVYVKKITLRNVYGIGTLALNSTSIEWKTEGDKGITVFEAGIKEDEKLQQTPPTPNYLMTETGYLMMLPQTLKDAAIDVLYWNGKDETDNKIITYTLPTNDPSYATWKPGQKYIYKFGTQSEDITVIYYEQYADNSYGIYDGTTNSLKDAGIIEAGYGAVSKKSIGNVAGIRLTNPLSTAVTSGTVVKLADDSFLYPVSQSAASTFNLPTSTIPQNVYFNGSTKSCGMIVPHFAKGVYTKVQTPMTTHSIRTPQQMRNITQSDASSARNTHTYTQELNLDFSKESIGGGTLATAVVNRQFNDLFNANSKRIQNVTIQAFTNGALFQGNGGEIKEVVLVNSSINSSGNTGGIVAVNQASGIILRPRVIGEDNANPFKIEGTSGYAGAIAGYNYGTITGNTEIESATELPIAEVSGWVSIKGVSAGTGGIAGENVGTITTCLVNGVHVTGSNLGDVEIAKITIEGGNYVGGIVGVNKSKIDGNRSNAGSGGTLQAEPDLAGIVSVSGNNFVGGIAGQNSGTLDQVNIRLGRGDAVSAMIIKGAVSVGGIVGYNTGTLQANGNSFISVRGNVHISGTENVGGIVGNNQNGNITNCFVYNFYSQSTTSALIHYAPKITGGTNVGGIAGYAGSGTIKQSAVFSTVSSANAATGDVTNAVAKIKATTTSVGGIVGRGFSGLAVTQSFVLGNVKVEGAQNSGGIVGENDPGTSIALVHIGNSGTEVTEVYNKLFKVVNLPVYDTRMQTNGGVMTKTSGTPTIEVSGWYAGGICGVNWGTIDGVSIKDNVNIGTSSGTFVGGIAGGNGVNGTIKNCLTYNPSSGDSNVAIIGNEQVGGVVGLNNGVVDGCQLGWPEQGSSRLITIKGKTKLGGIAGSNGGNLKNNGTGNEYTKIVNSNVYGKVLIATEATNNWDRNIVGGILGENGATNSVVNCNVIGYASSGNSTAGYDITLKGYDKVGGIAGANYGDIYGNTSSYSRVTHTAVIADNGYAGGLVGFQQSTAAYPGKLYYCDVSRGVLIHYLATHSGAFVGQLDGQGGTSSAPILFGTTFGGVTNRIYTGTSEPVVINGNSAKVILPPLIGNILPFYPEQPMAPDATTGNLWTRFAPYNYLHYTAY